MRKTRFDNKYRLQGNIILKEDDQIITDTTELCEIFSTFFSSYANNIGQPDEIDMRELDVLINIIDRHENHKSILDIKEHLKNVPGFDFKPVKVEHVENLLHKLDMNKQQVMIRFHQKWSSYALKNSHKH